MSVERELNMTVIDSLNFLPMTLSKLPEAFGSEEMKKRWFPHHFNKQENTKLSGTLSRGQILRSRFHGREGRQN